MTEQLEISQAAKCTRCNGNGCYMIGKIPKSQLRGSPVLAPGERKPRIVDCVLCGGIGIAPAMQPGRGGR